ncbi:60S ribosomal protein L34 [Tanacetum coccineum]
MITNTLSMCGETDIDNNDDEISDVEMEDITGYTASDFVGEYYVVIPNRSINGPFLNKLCNGSNINDFSDNNDVGESSQPCGKELEINSDDEDVDKQFKLVDGVIYPEFDHKLPWNEIKPTLGLRFEHPEQLKDFLTNYGVANGYQLWYRRNDYRSLFVLCGRDLAEGRSNGKKRCIQEQIKRKYLIMLVWEWCKKEAKACLIRGGLIESLQSRLWDFRKHFWKRILAMIKGWNEGCRKVIGLDGCFLKGTCRGELLTVMGKDENNQMFPIAWVVVNVENTDNWEWFLACLCEDLDQLWCIHDYYFRWSQGKTMVVDRNPNSWCRAFFKMDRGCAAYENGISESYQNSIRIARVISLSQWVVHLCGPKLQKSLICHQSLERCQEKGHNKKTCKKEKQPKPAVKKRTPGRRKVVSNFVFQAGPSVADPSSAGPSVVDPSSAGPSVADPSSAGPSVADSTSLGTQIIKDAIATGRLKTAGLRRRCKSERIAKRAKAFRFGKDGAGLVGRHGLW